MKDPGCDLSLILVCFHSSGVCRHAVESFRAQAAELGRSFEVILIDHSENDEESARLALYTPERLIREENLGYAAGLNRGVEEASGDILLLGNPDIHFEPGALAALCLALETGWDVVGPQFVLQGFHFPPADEQKPVVHLRHWLASRWPYYWKLAFRRELKRWRGVWDAHSPVAVANLSGALLAFHRPVWQQLGRWDSGFFLYFEETDWLKRAQVAGLRCAVVPAAKVEHEWGHAADPAGSFGHFLTSRRRYYTRHFGQMGNWLASLPLGHGPFTHAEVISDAGRLPAGERLWLVSTSLLGLQAVSYQGDGGDLLAAMTRAERHRGRKLRYLLLALHPDQETLEGSWLWEDRSE